ncbi:uncharacterized protein LAESUDRAFT_664748 [Laetiporus sulphureus 93-53]|uniref:Uncharacterized protein n=1 Tax=Laetiporus sulphureus 93-53 TaxID=1314785 RepID=A0A165BGT1_9APHY|nr:uncharacterized protein LAESUDRAFT_664748 [Laetiporus sulphureus 93-53]KZT01026.1 hypothetical protein LAESUDRAFT_664748 [Laetiporus sulphureus 93-53]
MLTFSQNFLPLLKDHILGRLRGRPYDGDERGFSHQDHHTMIFEKNRMYFHKVLRVNYTTYDMRRMQDSINPRTHPNIMVAAHEEDDDDNPEASKHPYWYARIIGIFHVNVRHTGPFRTSDEVQRMEVLWVRWYGRDVDALGGFETRRLHRIGFADGSDPNAFRFLNPAVIIRAAHIIPAFAYGRTADLLPASPCARLPEEEDMDYEFYYVNM